MNNMKKCMAWLCQIGMTFSTPASAHEPSCHIAQLDLQAYEAAIEEYAATHGTLPNERDWLDALRRDKLISAKPRSLDPWGNEYSYRSSKAAFDLRTVGPDGVYGSADDQLRANRWTWTQCREPWGRWFWGSCGGSRPP